MATNLTASNVLNLISYYEDSAYLCSEDFNSEEEYDEAFTIADEELIDYSYIETERYGNGYRAIWHKEK